MKFKCQQCGIIFECDEDTDLCEQCKLDAENNFASAMWNNPDLML